jgi:hypothetical protein
MAQKERLCSIHIDVADNGFEICACYEPVKKSKDHPFEREERKEVYQTASGAEKCVHDHLKEAEKQMRLTQGEHIMSGDEEEESEEDEY